MAGTITFGGLVSGIDTNALVDKLIALEKAPITAYQTHQTDDNTKLTTLATLVSQVQALSDAGNDLALSSQANPLSASSSNTGVASAAAGSTAVAGSHTLVVDHLARAQVNSSTAFDTDATPGAGTLDFKVGTGSNRHIAYAAGDTLESVAGKINDLLAGVTASVLFDGTQYRLMVSANTTGTAAGVHFADGSGLGLTASDSIVVTPLDARFSFDNIWITRGSNHVTDAAPGLTLDLTGATGSGSPTSIVVSVDRDALAAKVQKIVDSYNAVQKTVSGQLAYTGSKAATSTLFADGGLEQLQRTASGLFAGSYGQKAWSPSQLGIALGKDGTLSFDKTAFTTALGNDPTAAQDLLTGNGNAGLAKSLVTALAVFTRPMDGVLVAEQDRIKSDFASWASKIQQTNDEAAKLDARLRAQFGAMERALALLNSQSSLLLALGAGASASSSLGSSGSSGFGSTSSSSSTSTTKSG